MRILDHPSAGVAGAVLRHDAEFGIHVAGAPHPDLTSAPLLRDRFVLVCRDDHPLAAKKRVAWRALVGHQLIVAGPGSSNRPVLDRVSGTVDVLSSFYEVQRSSTAVGLVAEGLGAAIVPRMAMQDGAFPNLRIVPLVEPVVYKHLVLIVRRNAQLSPAAQALHALIRENAR